MSTANHMTQAGDELAIKSILLRLPVSKHLHALQNYLHDQDLETLPSEEKALLLRRAEALQLESAAKTILLSMHNGELDPAIQALVKTKAEQTARPAADILSALVLGPLSHFAHQPISPEQCKVLHAAVAPLFGELTEKHFDFGAYEAQFSTQKDGDQQHFRLKLALRDDYIDWLSKQPSTIREEHESMLKTGLERVKEQWEKNCAALGNNHHAQHVDMLKHVHTANSILYAPSNANKVHEAQERIEGTRALASAAVDGVLAAKTERCNQASINIVDRATYSLTLDNCITVGAHTYKTPVQTSATEATLLSTLHDLEDGLRVRTTTSPKAPTTENTRDIATHYKMLAVAFRGISPVTGLGRFLG